LQVKERRKKPEKHGLTDTVKILRAFIFWEAVLGPLAAVMLAASTYLAHNCKRHGTVDVNTFLFLHWRHTMKFWSSIIKFQSFNFLPVSTFVITC